MIRTGTRCAVTHPDRGRCVTLRPGPDHGTAADPHRYMLSATIARRAAQREAAGAVHHADVLAHMHEAAADPDPLRAAFWSDLLQDHMGRCDRCASSVTGGAGAGNP